MFQDEVPFDEFDLAPEVRAAYDAEMRDLHRRWQHERRVDALDHADRSQLVARLEAFHDASQVADSPDVVPVTTTTAHRFPRAARRVSATVRRCVVTLCGHHHRVKHETGWTVRLPEPEDADIPPGTLIWTSPTGRDHANAPIPF